MKFVCDCGFHRLEITKDRPSKNFPHSTISIIITEHRSGHTGKLYKKPKLLGDVVFISTEPEYKKLVNFLKKL